MKRLRLWLWRRRLATTLRKGDRVLFHNGMAMLKAAGWASWRAPEYSVATVHDLKDWGDGQGLQAGLARRSSSQWSPLGQLYPLWWAPFQEDY